MKSAIETFMGIVIITLMAVIATCYITASIDTRHAQNFHAGAIAEIEASNHAESVISDCAAKAKENGFTIEDASENEVSGLETKETAMGVTEVTLKYHYTIPFLNIFLEHQIVGYAR